MAETVKSTQYITPSVRILRLNIDKSKKSADTPPNYKVHFQLSTAPDSTWGKVFATEWISFNSEKGTTLSDAVIERDFLVIQSPLADIASVYLPSLTEAVSRTNEAYLLLLNPVDEPA